MIAESPAVFVSKAMDQKDAKNHGVSVSSHTFYFMVNFCSPETEINEDGCDAALIEARRKDPRKGLDAVIRRLKPSR